MGAPLVTIIAVLTFGVSTASATLGWGYEDLDAVNRLKAQLSSGANLYDASFKDYVAFGAPVCQPVGAFIARQAMMPTGPPAWPVTLDPQSATGKQCSLNKGFNSFFNGVVPAFMVLATTEQDVVAAVNFARELKLQTTIRSGLHNLGGLGFVQGGMVIDLRRMRKITVDESTATITFEGGIRFGDLDKQLWDNHKGWAMPNGADGHIGATGAHLGVGTGYLERWLGAGTDNIVGARIVLANGTLVAVDQGHELLFAIKGAASNFGVITQLTEKIHKVLDVSQTADLREAKMFVPLAAAKEAMQMVENMVNFPLGDWEANYPNSPWSTGDKYPNNCVMVPIFYYEVPWEISAGQVGVMTSYSFWRNPGDTEDMLKARSKPWEDRFRNIVNKLAHKGAYFQMLDLMNAPAVPTTPINLTALPPTAFPPGGKCAVNCTANSTFSPDCNFCANNATRGFATWTYQRIQADTQLPLQQSWYPHGGFLKASTVGLTSFNQMVEKMVTAWTDMDTKVPTAKTSPFFNTALFQWGGKNDMRDQATSSMPSTSANQWLAVMWAAWIPPMDGYPGTKWVKDLFAASSSLIEYNYIDGTPFDGRSLHTARWTYGKNKWPQLVSLKAKYDPENFWRNNVNVHPPSLSSSSSTSPSSPGSSAVPLGAMCPFSYPTGMGPPWRPDAWKSLWASLCLGTGIGSFCPFDPSEVVYRGQFNKLIGNAPDSSRRWECGCSKEKQLGHWYAPYGYKPDGTAWNCYFDVPVTPPQPMPPSVVPSCDSVTYDNGAKTMAVTSSSACDELCNHYLSPDAMFTSATGVAQCSCGNTFMCSGSISTPSPSPEECAKASEAVVDQYLKKIATQDIDGACTFLKGGTKDTTFAFNWHGDKNLVPIGGEYTGCNGLKTFFGLVGKSVKDFKFFTPYAPSSSGIRSPGSTCGTVVKQWEEVSTVIKTGKPVTKAVNTVVYKLNTTTSPPTLIQGDVWIDSTKYAHSFCPGQIACFDSGAVSSSTTTSTNSDGGGTSAISTAILVIVILQFLLFLFSLNSSARSSGAEKRDSIIGHDDGRPYQHL